MAFERNQNEMLPLLERVKLIIPIDEHRMIVTLDMKLFIYERGVPRALPLRDINGRPLGIHHIHMGSLSNATRTLVLVCSGMMGDYILSVDLAYN
jgi:hypothetical protein